MNSLGRKIMFLLAVIFMQSSLGTNAVLLEAQNLGQNGYIKYSNGLLIQWGKQPGSTATTITIYMPLSFYNTDYLSYPQNKGH